MAIIQNNADISYRYKGFKDLKNWLLLVLDHEKLIPGEITLVYCSDQYLKSVNRKYLQRDYFTDVITFDYSKENIISGDILISITRIRENAQMFNTCFKNELDRVILHGVLHLAGYKDSKQADLNLMREKEDFYLSLRN